MTSTSRNNDGSITVRLSKADWMKILGLLVSMTGTLAVAGWRWGNHLESKVDDHGYRLASLEDARREDKIFQKEILLELKTLRSAIDTLNGRLQRANP